MESTVIPSIISYLQNLTQDSHLTREQKESIDDAFSFEIAESSIDLLSCIEDFQQKKKITSSIDTEKANFYKSKGNDALLEKNYQSAVDNYTKAIEMNPNDAVFYSNRAAAWMHLREVDANALLKAEEDSLKALELDQNYAKAQSRLGSIYLAQKKYKQAVEALEKALNLDPTNTTIKSQLNEAKKVSDESCNSSTSPPLGGNLGGLDFSSLLSDPNLMSMAQNFMNSDTAKGLLSNPNIANLAQQFLGGSKNQSNK